MHAPFVSFGLLPGEIVVDSFAGGGGTSEGIRQAIGRDPDIAINHDALALAMHRVNHPGTHHMVEDVWHVDALGMCDGRPIGLLWLSPDCFPAGTLVLTSKGYRAVETIEVGDLVLTHRNRWRAVTETHQATRPVITLRGHGHPGLTVSIEHPFYARRRRDVWSTIPPRGYRRTLDDADWVPASALDQGWYWATPTRFPKVGIPLVGGRGLEVDARLMWLAGRYLGDGWTRLTETRAEIVITCGNHEVDALRAKLAVWPREGARCTSQDEIAWHERSTGTAYQFSTSHRGLVEWLREHFGHRAEAKGIPGWALGMREDLKEALVAGYVSADGWRSETFHETRTVSAALAFSTKALLNSMGFTVTVHRLANSSEIEGRQVSARPIYLLRWRHTLDAAHAQVFREEDHEWAPIREQIDNGDVQAVFNIGVDEDESYVVEGIVVHNCKHFSKAKGGKPREKAIRGLAWVGLRWVKSLPKRQRPRVIALENVEEFQDWGPLLDDGKPCPLQKGATFKNFISGFEALGYVAEWRELRACDYGDPTIRKRLFVVLRRDKQPIVWPERTHGNPKNAADAALIASGVLKPWRTAAEIIDFRLPCPSIFETSAEIKAALGLRAIRPLADNTMSRVAKGTMRYVVNSAKPFIVKVNHTERGEERARHIDEPLSTMTGKRDDALVMPFVSYAQQGGAVRDITDPLNTITASSKDQNAVVMPFVTKFNTGSVGSGIEEPLPTITSHASETHGGGAAPLGLVAPLLVRTAHGEADKNGRKRGRGDHSVEDPMPTILASNDSALVAPHLMTMRNAEKPFNGADEPVHTIMAGGAGLAVVAPILVGCGGRAGQSEPRPADEPVLTQTAKADACVITPFLVPRYAEKPGHEPRVRSIDEPVATIIAGDNVPGSLVTPFLVPRYGERPGQEPRTRAVDEPMSVVVPTANEGSIAAVHLSRQFGASVGGRADEPAPTVTAGGDGKTALVAAFLAQHNTDMVGHEVDKPLSTIVAKGINQNLVAAHMLNLRGSDRRDAAADMPLQTVSAQGNHAALVAAFLAKYYGAGEPVQAADDPLHTVTAKPRHGLVTVTIDGESFVITDIGMRMLTPRERFSAQGFRPDYVIDYGILEDGSRVIFTLEQQGRMCGNSVCPGMARALVAANMALRPTNRRAARQRPLPLLTAAE